MRALQLGEASQVAPIDKLSLIITIILAVVLLREKLSLAVVVGGIMMGVGAVIISFGK